MEEPIDFILAAFDRVEDSNKNSVTQQQETNALLKQVSEELRKSNRQSETAANRIEGAAAKIPASVTIVNREEHGITRSAKVWLSVVLICILATYLVTPEIAQHRLEQQEIKINNQQFELNYLRDKNPKSAAAFDEKYSK